MSNLPRSWIEVSFEDVMDVNPRKSVNLDENDSVTFVPMAAVSEVSGTIVEGVIRQLREVNKGFTQFAEGDVIFAKITPSMENGKSAVAIGLENSIGFGSTEFHVFRSHGAVLPEYLWRFIRQSSFRNAAQKVMSGAVGQQRVPADYLKKHQLPLPPLAEQRRILAKIEQLMTRTTRARSELGRIPILVENYKEAILKSVFGNVKGREVTIRELTEFVTSGSRGWAKYYSSQGPLFLRVGNTKRGSIELDISDTQCVKPPEGAEGTRTRVSSGDILVTITADIGRIAIIPEDFGEAYVNQHIALIRFNSPEIARYVAWFMASPEGQARLHENNHGMTRAGLSLDNIRNVRLILPEPESRKEIIRLIETSFNWLDSMTTYQSAATTLLAKLDNAILSKAFRGELIPQDPYDEPASSLLVRIRSEYNAVINKPQQRRTRDKLMIKAPKERLLHDSESWPDKGLPFEEIAKRNSTIPYDEMRDAIFALLAEKKPSLQQVFDKEANCMYLQRTRT